MSRQFHLDRAIRGERESHAWDAAIAAIAERQHGVVSREQLLGIGLTSDAIHWRIQVGRLHPLHGGVYAVGHRAISREGRYLAAVLASGESARESYVRSLRE